MKKTIAILFHQSQDLRSTRGYVVSYLADHWREDGHRVEYLFGTKKYIPADLCLVHIDLSVVPEEYLDFADRYPITLNGKVRDIRKKSFSRIMVTRNDPYGGVVIVKSDLNHAGAPERNLHRHTVSGVLSRIGHRFNFLTRRYSIPNQYRIYDRLADVPRVCFQDPYFIVEKFLPEREGGLYFVHSYRFLGDCHQCIRHGSREPVVNGKSSITGKIVRPHPDIITMRQEMNFDYGKFDYVLHDGKIVLLDANKTVGHGNIRHNIDQLAASRRQRAHGLYAYFK